MIEVKNLTVKYPDGTTAIDDLSFTAQDGESIALVGANGAGKTTLLLALVGVLPIFSGSITVDGTVLDKKNLKHIQKRVGLVFQNPDDQLFMPNIFDDISFGAKNLGFSEVEVTSMVEKTLEALNITHLRDKSSLKLSGGEKRMAAIAGVLIMNPTTMLFDEPTAFLDPRARRKLITTLNSLPQTKIIATHDMDFALEVCEHTILIKKGQLLTEGESDKVLFNQQIMEDALVEAIKRR